MADYTVAIPSRARPENIPKLLQKFPDAIVFVHSDEKAAYQQYTPKGQLKTHDIVQGMPAIRNFMLDNSPAEVVLMVDDDFDCVRSNVWRRPRYYRSANEIDAIVRNGVAIMTDLETAVYAWSSDKIPIWFSPHQPFRVASHFIGAWLMRRKRFRFDERLVSSGDNDLFAQAMLHQRLVLTDRRFTFQFSAMFGTTGGMQLLRTSETVAADRKLLKEKWGKYCRFVKAGKSTNTFPRMVVKRKSSLGFNG